MSQLESLHPRHGGKEAAGHRPSQKVSFVLGAGLLTQWTRCLNSAVHGFYPRVAEEVKRNGVTELLYTADQMGKFQQSLFCTIPHNHLVKYLKYILSGVKDKRDRDDVLKEFVRRGVLMIMSRITDCNDSHAAYALCRDTRIDQMLQNTLIGGKEEYTIEAFVQMELKHGWDRQRMMEDARNFLTEIVCYGHSPMKNPICVICNIGYVKIHKGDGEYVKDQACLVCAEKMESQEAVSGKRKAVEGVAVKPESKKGPAEQARGMGGIDKTAQGIVQSYEQKVKLLAERYEGMEPQEIIQKIIGKDIFIDTPGSSSIAYLGMTGEQPGKLLASYLVSVKGECDFLRSGVMHWLEKLKAKKQKEGQHPMLLKCLAAAIAYLPKLEEGLARARAEAAFRDEVILDAADLAASPPPTPAQAEALGDDDFAASPAKTDDAEVQTAIAEALVEMLKYSVSTGITAPSFHIAALMEYIQTNRATLSCERVAAAAGEEQTLRRQVEGALEAMVLSGDISKRDDHPSFTHRLAPQ